MNEKKPESECPSFRLYRMCQVEKLTGVSRSTLHRMRREGRLRAVEIRKGSYRYPESELWRLNLVGGADECDPEK